MRGWVLRRVDLIGIMVFEAERGNSFECYLFSSSYVYSMYGMHVCWMMLWKRKTVLESRRWGVRRYSEERTKNRKTIFAFPVQFL